MRFGRKTNLIVILHKCSDERFDIEAELLKLFILKFFKYRQFTLVVEDILTYICMAGQALDIMNMRYIIDIGKHFTYISCNKQLLYLMIHLNASELNQIFGVYSLIIRTCHSLGVICIVLCSYTCNNIILEFK